MNESLASFVVGRGIDDQPLTLAARAALEANPNPRIVKMRIGPSGLPIEIPENIPPQSELPM